eukprot:COSAG03_NODE_424_length_8020_cov_3.740184_10_plen_53_part_00
MRNSTQYQYFPFVECLLELATEDSQQKEQANADQRRSVSKVGLTSAFETMSE